jgi:HEPN domain-containing protein
MRNNPLDPESWFDYAEQDLVRAHKRFAEGDAMDGAHHLQQCAEKVMKGKLIGLGWPLQKTHNLTALLKELRAHALDIDWFTDAADVLTVEYIADRYPGFDDAPPSADELRKFATDTTTLFESLSGRKYTGPPSLPSPV